MLFEGGEVSHPGTEIYTVIAYRQMSCRAEPISVRIGCHGDGSFVIVSSPDHIKSNILAAVKRIPRGRVSTYGGVADLAGLPGRARLVGKVLSQMPSSTRLPWHRVVNAGGRISFPVGTDAHGLQRRRLEAEGVVFTGARIDLRRFGWPSPEAQLDEYLWRPRGP
jgi:methylated-DNA-protein-cysteine methyltransferase related protein